MCIASASDSENAVLPTQISCVKLSCRPVARMFSLVQHEYVTVVFVHSLRLNSPNQLCKLRNNPRYSGRRLLDGSTAIGHG